MMRLIRFFSLSLLCLTAFPASAAVGPDENVRLGSLLRDVYESMEMNYYRPVSRVVYENFLTQYPAARLKAMNEATKQTEDYVHLGAGLLVNKLKAPTDRFTNFVPPSKSKAFKSDAYAVTENLGITGKQVEGAYEILKVQKHSDAYLTGLRRGNRILAIDGNPVSSMTEEAIEKRLKPPLGSKVRLFVWFHMDGRRAEIILQAKPYFEETVEMLPPPSDGVAAIKITHFNQVTSKDFADLLFSIRQDQRKRLVLDLRGNRGGPPLAAREILGYLTPANDPLFTIARKSQRPLMLLSPKTKEHFSGEIVVLVDENTASAAEMMSGVLQAKNRAVLVGQKTAGSTYLKSIYDFQDGSMIIMITSLTFYFDRRPFPEDGLTPDRILEKGEDPLQVLFAHVNAS